MMADADADLCAVVGEHMREQRDIEVVGLYTDGDALLRALDVVEADIVILDMSMSRIDGLSVLEGIRAQVRRDSPVVIAVSPFVPEGVMLQARSLGVRNFLYKPLDLETLCRRVRQPASESPRCDHRHLPIQSRRMGESFAEEVGRIMGGMGVPPHVRGYKYLRRAILLVVSRPEFLEAVTKELYPAIAAHYRSTPQRVERAIRHAIQCAYERGAGEKMMEMVGFVATPGVGRPSNAECIASVAEYLRTAHLGHNPGFARNS